MASQLNNFRTWAIILKPVTRHVYNSLIGVHSQRRLEWTLPKTAKRFTCLFAHHAIWPCIYPIFKFSHHFVAEHKEKWCPKEPFATFPQFHMAAILAIASVVFHMTSTLFHLANYRWDWGPCNGFQVWRHQQSTHAASGFKQRDLGIWKDR